MKWSHVILLLILFTLVIGISGIFFPPDSTPEQRGGKMVWLLVGLLGFWFGVRAYEGKWYNKGVDFTESKEYEKALNAYDQALLNDDKNPDIWNNKCFVLTKLGRCDEAIIAGNKAVQLNPKDPELRDTLRQAEECQKNMLRVRK
jgi:tetratricopeptide (TPR) repeat protein